MLRIPFLKLIKYLYGTDRDYIKDGKLVGMSDKPYNCKPLRDLEGQRGLHFI